MLSLAPTLLSWLKAEEFCIDKDAHLASVTNLGIHNYIRSRVDTNDYRTFFWIGGTDQEQEGKWSWTDGSGWNFTKWATSHVQQPDDFGGREDCLQIYSSRTRDGWNDQSCESERRFVCSRRICQCQAGRNNNDLDPNFLVLSTVVLTTGIFLIIILIITVACAACKCS